MTDVVMLTYDFNEQLADLSQQTIFAVKQAPIDKLIVVDNGSEFGAGRVREHTDIYIRNKFNLGYPEAVNQGFALSTAPYVAISNNDIRVPANWMTVAEEIFAQDPKVGTVHFRMIPYDQPFNPGDNVWITGKERWCHCSFFVIRREAFQVYDLNYDKGGFDDYDHNYRMREKGWKQAYTNRVEFQHMDSITYRTMESGEDRAKRDAKNKEYYKEKFGMYPDDQFNKEFSEQITLPYLPFP